MATSDHLLCHEMSLLHIWSRSGTRQMRVTCTTPVCTCESVIIEHGGFISTYMFDTRFLRCIDKASVLFSPLLDIEGLGAHEQEILHVLEGGLHGSKMVVVDYSEC